MFAFLGALALVIVVAIWGILTLAVSQEPDKYPALNRLTSIINLVLIVGALVFITYFNLWC